MTACLFRAVLMTELVGTSRKLVAAGCGVRFTQGRVVSVFACHARGSGVQVVAL